MQRPPIPRLPEPGRSRIAARPAAGLALGMLMLELQAADPKRVPSAKAVSSAKQAVQMGGRPAAAAAAPVPTKPGLAPAANAATAARIAAARITTLGGPEATASDAPEGIDAGSGGVSPPGPAETSVAPKANAATAARIAALARTLPSRPGPAAPDVAPEAADAVGMPAGTEPDGEAEAAQGRRRTSVAAQANAATAARVAAAVQPAAATKPQPAEAEVVPAATTSASAEGGAEEDAEHNPQHHSQGIAEAANAATAARIAALLQSQPAPPGLPEEAGQTLAAAPDADADAEPKPPRRRKGVGPDANAATAARIAALAMPQKKAATDAADRADRPRPGSPPTVATASPARKAATAVDSVSAETGATATLADTTPLPPPESGGSAVSAPAAGAPTAEKGGSETGAKPEASQAGSPAPKSRIANAARAATAARIAALALPNAVPLDLSRVFADDAAADQARALRGSAATDAVIKSAALPPPAPELLPPSDAVSPARTPGDAREAGAGEASGNAESGRDPSAAPAPLVPEAAPAAGDASAKPAKPGRGGKAGKATGKNGKDTARRDKTGTDADKDKSDADKDKSGAEKEAPNAAPDASGTEASGTEAGGAALAAGAGDGDPASPEQKPAAEAAYQPPGLPRQGLRIIALPELVGAPPVVTVESPESLKAFVQPGDEMTLLESMRRALYYSYAVRAAAARVETTKQTERTALSRLLPRVDARMSAGQAKYDATARPTPPEWMLRVDRSVTAAQPLFNWSDYMTWRQQGALVSAEQERRANTDSATALEAASAFLSVYQAQLIIEYGESYRELLADLERYVSERASSGATSVADADRVRARVANAQSILAEGRASLISAMGNLRRLVGALPERVTVGTLDTSILPETLDGARTEATAANPELLASRREVDAATLERRAVFGRFMPNIELEVSQLEFRNTSGQVGNQSDSRVLVVMNLPIYAGGGDLATTRALAAKRQEKEFNLGEKERKLLFDLESAFSVIESINPRLESTRVELEANLKVVAAFREQLFASNRSLLDVLDAYQRLYQSKVDMTTLLVNEARTKLQVAHLSGRLRQILPTVEITP
jgi:adhesin transport system outer membrane protein